jgi:hypothetical protein
MTTHSTALAAALASATTRIAHGTAKASAFGSTGLRFRCKRDSNAGAADPWNTGTEFINIGMAGPLAVNPTTGAVTLGTLSGTTTRAGADLSTGKSVWRIVDAGGTIYQQGSIGLPGSGCDLIMSASPAANSGFVIASATIFPPSSLPINGPEVPYRVVMEDWSSGSAVDAGSAIFDTDAASLAFQHADIAAQIGTTYWKQSSQSLALGNFEFGVHLFTLDARVNADANVPGYEIRVGIRPRNTWAKYPVNGISTGAYNAATDSTIPPPHKLRYENSSGTVLGRSQMQDGLPVNGAGNTNAWSASVPYRPWFNVKMMHKWVSCKLKTSAKATKFFPGMVAEALRPSMAKQGYSCNEVYTTMGAPDALNSGSHWFATERWPLPKDQRDSTTDYLSSDPYLFDIGTYAAYEGRPAHVTGWDYEPGSMSARNVLTGPGGSRFDRSALPTSIVLDISDPTGTRLKDGVPYSTMRKAWGDSYCNNAYHEFTDVKTLARLPDVGMVAGDYVYGGSYYDPGSPIKDADHTVQVYTAGQSASTVAYDKDGRSHYNGFARDNLHSYDNPAAMVYLYNSPVDVIGATMAQNAHIMAQLVNAPANSTPAGYFMQRNHAWRWKMYVEMWLVGTTHPLGRTQAQQETLFQTELETIYTQIVVPATTPADANYNTQMSTALRNLGVSCRADGAVVVGTQKFWRMETKSHVFYMSQVLQMMLQSGLWDVMHAKNAACAAALDYTIRCLDLYCIDWILDTGGRMELYAYLPSGEGDGEAQPISAGVATGAANPSICASWAAWGAAWPKVGSRDWLYLEDGTTRAGRPEQDITQHLRAQYAFMRRDNPGFGISNARLADACAAYQGYYDIITARTAAAATPVLKREADWTFMLPCVGFKLKTPTA